MVMLTPKATTVPNASTAFANFGGKLPRAMAEHQLPTRNHITQATTPTTSATLPMFEYRRSSCCNLCHLRLTTLLRLCAIAA
jgi:hypothetical protein